MAGADIKEIAAIQSSEQAYEMLRTGQAVFSKIEKSSKPVIAAMTGRFWLGGGNELAMACHIRLAEDGVQIGQPEIKWAMTPGWGGTQRLPRLIGKASAKHVYGLFPNHQWDIGGSGDADISLTSIQGFYTYLPGGGWNVGSGPTATYDWEAEQWTVPLQVNAGKTVVWGGRPWKLSIEANYYVEKSEAFGPEWMIGINLAPVVKNPLAN